MFMKDLKVVHQISILVHEQTIKLLYAFIFTLVVDCLF